MVVSVSTILVAAVLAATPGEPPVTAANLFEEPRFTCRLQELMGPDGYEHLKESMQLVEDSGHVVTGGVRGLFRIMEGIVVPGDPPAAAFLRNNEVWIYARTVAEPPEIRAWRMKRAPQAVPVRKRPANWKPKECEPAALARRVAAIDCTSEVARFNAPELGIVQQRAAKAWFQSDPTPCPAAGACAARTRAFVVARDLVEFSSNVKPRNGFLCARFVGPKTATVGWLPGAALELTLLEPGHFAALPPSAWDGRWSGAHAEIVIAEVPRPSDEAAAVLRVTGAASSGGNTGEVDAVLRVDRDLMIAKEGEGEYSCELKLQLANNAVIANDNGGCGGLGVTFSGALYRAPRR